MRELFSDTRERTRPLVFSVEELLHRVDDDVHDPNVLGLLAAIEVNATSRGLILRNERLSLKAQESFLELLTKNLNQKCIEIHNIRCDEGKRIPLPAELFRNDCLTEVHLSHCALSFSACKALATRLKSADGSSSLSSLTLSKVEFLGDDNKQHSTALELFASALSLTNSVQVLKLSSIVLVECDKVLLMKGLAGNSGHSLRVIHVEDIGLNEEHVPWLAHLLANEASQLSELSLRKNNLNAKAVEIIVSHGLCCNSTLRRLNLSENPVGDKGAARLAMCLKDSHSIQELRLVDCDIWRPGCLELALAMPFFSGLTRLSLDGNDVEDCLDQVIEAIKLNFNLVHVLDSLPSLLRLKRRKRQPNGGSASVCGQYHVLDFYLRMNRARRRFLIEPILPSLIPKLFTEHGANKDPSILYHFLRRSPPLVG
jgi:Ran GTPase-activating protein (RanGAP) involved in mRNA processing and transport